MNLNSSKLIFGLIILNSGNCLYFSNNIIQLFSFNGGRIPDIKFHSTIESPESVNLVKPPIKTIMKTRKQDVNNHK